jgi:trans-aconitate 2-methyltransferase
VTAQDWSPAQYEKFERERARPFYDLVDLVDPVPGGRVADLGCGPGTRTVELATKLQAAQIVGMDHSAAMLARARQLECEGVRFEVVDIARFDDRAAWDVVFSNAALHWVADHDALFVRLAAALRPGGQLAVQMPYNFDHPASATASSLAAESPYVERLGGRRQGAHVDPVESYATRLHACGLTDIDVHLRVYLHELPGPASVIEWTRGSTLTWYRAQLGLELYDQFEAEYRRRLLAVLPDEQPLLFTFKRIFAYGRQTGG